MNEFELPAKRLKTQIKPASTRITPRMSSFLSGEMLNAGPRSGADLRLVVGV